LSPFFPAYLAVLSAGPRAAFIAGCLGALAGAYGGGDFVGDVVTAGGITILHLLPRLRSEMRSSPVRMALLAAAVVMITRGATGVLADPRVAMLTGLAEGPFVLVLVLVFRRGLEAHHDFDSERLVCRCIVFAAGVAGAHGLQFMGLSLQSFLGALLVMVAGLSRGMGFGASAGTIIGLLEAVAGNLVPMRIGFLALGGLLSGALAGLGRVGAAVGFSLGTVLLRISQGLQPWEGLWEVLSAGALLWVVPSPFEQPEDGQRRTLHQREIHGLSTVFRELAAAFEEGKAKDQEPGPRNLLEAVIDRVCTGCKGYVLCWNQNFYQTYRGFLDLLDREGQPDLLMVRRNVPQCGRPGEVATAVGHIMELSHLDLFWRRRMVANREVMARQLRNMAEIIEDLNLQGRGPREERGVPALRVRTGAAEASGERVSGDSYLIRYLSGKRRVALVLSDGMGTGPRAAAESRLATALLDRLLVTGFERKLAIDTVNSVLLLRSQEDSFATLDVAMVDLVRCQVEFLKVGSAPSFVVKEGKVWVIRSTSVPVGILTSVELESVEVDVGPGTMLVMATDGLLSGVEDPAEAERWIYAYLRRADSAEPSVVARTLCEEAASRAVDDDITVLVASFF